MEDEERTEGVQNESSLPDKEARTWAFIAHLLGFLVFIFSLVGNVIGPLVVLLVKGEQSAFVKDHAKEALNFQISMDIYLVIAVILCFIVIGIPILIGLLIFDAIVMIVAAIAANEGRMYRYPMCIRFIQ